MESSTVMTSPFVIQSLPNGLRVVIERMGGVKSAAAGFLVRTGARHEAPEHAGVSHFLEHMCFKGTRNRSGLQINIDFDELGSYYNAFTTKDKTFYFGWVRVPDIDRQIELLADMMRSTLPLEEFQTERNVILEEIAMSNDQIDHLAYDFAHERVFGDHPLSWPVLGYECTISGLAHEAMVEYFARRYAADNLVLIVAGNVEPEEVMTAARRYCGEWEPSGAGRDEQVPEIRAGTSVRAMERFNQQLLGLIFPAPRGGDAWSENAEALASILGGENSRFYWNIMQQGLSPSAGVWRIDYADCGLMFFSAQAEPENCEKLTEAMRREAFRITEDGATPEEVQRVKNRRRTSLAVEGESPYHRVLQIMEDVDLYGAPRTVEQRLVEVDAVTAASLADYLGRWPVSGEGHLVSVGPRNWPCI